MEAPDENPTPPKRRGDAVFENGDAAALPGIGLLV